MICNLRLKIEVSKYNQRLYNILLKDRTTNHNIIWATSDYSDYGDAFSAQAEIKLMSDRLPVFIQPRIKKNKQMQTIRTREKAEVFTPSWICNKQNNLIDEQWFGKEEIEGMKYLIMCEGPNELAIINYRILNGAHRKDELYLADLLL